MMIRGFVFFVLVLLAVPAHAMEQAKSETRCGWLDNPTPANFFLNDKDRSWTISVQGGDQAEGMDFISDFPEDQFVNNGPGSYGYGCGCLTASFSEEEERVVSISSFEQKKLKDCLADPELPAMPK